MILRDFALLFLAGINPHTSDVSSHANLRIRLIEEQHKNKIGNNI